MIEKQKHSEDSLKKWYRQNKNNILSNVRYRVISPFVFFAIAFALFYPSILFINTYLQSDISQFALVILLLIPIIWAYIRMYRSLIQVGSEVVLSRSIYHVRKNVVKATSERKGSDFRSLQISINALRRNLKGFIQTSEVLTPPIPSFELVRLHKAIDTFLNTASEVLFPNPFVFSRAQKIEKEMALDYYYSQEHPTPEEIEEHYKSLSYDQEGIINRFDLWALDEFLQYLGDILFVKTTPYSPFPSRHPINIIQLTNFFDYWNDVISKCENSKSVYSKAKQDIEEYNKRIEANEIQRRQRMGELQDKALLVIVSVVLSIIVDFLLKA